MLIALTGGIASGKSTVARMFEDLGYYVIDADQVGHEIIQPQAPAWYDIIQYFSKEYLNDDGTINREKLGALVFAQADKRKLLNQITHPRIIAHIREIIARKRQEGYTWPIMVDAALVIEESGYQRFDKLIVVYVDEVTQRARIRARDGFSEEEITRRLSSQMPLSEKAKLADYVIDNSGTIEETRRQVLAVHEQLQKEVDRRQ